VQDSYIADAIGSQLLRSAMMPSQAVSLKSLDNLSFLVFYACNVRQKFHLYEIYKSWSKSAITICLAFCFFFPIPGINSSRIFMKKKRGWKNNVGFKCSFAFLQWFSIWCNSYICVSHMWKLQVIVCEESFHGISGMSFVITLTRPTLMLNLDAILTLYAGWNP